MRAVWRGVLVFGVVAFPVRLVPVVREPGVRFRLVHRGDSGRIRHRRVCEVCGEEVGVSEVVRAVEVGDGRVVVVEDAELAGVPVPPQRVIEVVQVARAEEVDPVVLGRAFHVEPEVAAVGSFVLLRDALARAGRVGVARVVFRRRERVVVVRPRGAGLVVQSVVWFDQVREPDLGFLAGAATASASAERMASALVESMTAPWDLSVFEDRFAAAVRGAVEAKFSPFE
ncbi:non-homologous end joining protein Ku [Saccharothrix variisporea]|uniref:DNA end-binding protein Ku n=1 Tax=Saccharothrix variisporea TaxID=543527 RepID=A0A495WZR6_9PSEU|nr:Ku protein [Saccharothrix variisporea]RKT67361.1 DNA end-binding protein Ku [Saccharothrix variisporea]